MELLFTQAKRHFPKDTRLQLLFAYVLGNRLGFRWRAINEIQRILVSNNASLIIKINALSYLEQIELRLKEEELKTSQLLGLNTHKILAQQKKIEDFKKLLASSCDKSKGFWQELLEKKPNANKLQRLGFQIAEIAGNIQEFVSELFQNENQRSMFILQLYSDYLLLVAGETEEEKRLSAKIEVVANSITAGEWYGKENRLKNIEVGNPCILITSCNSEDMGLIKTANIHASNLLFYGKHELEGQNIEIIMPGAFRIHHTR